MTTAASASTSDAACFVPDQSPQFAADTNPPLTAGVGQPYGYAFVASGTPAPPYTLAVGKPSWLSIDATTGVVSGTPPTGTTTFTYSVIASNRAANKCAVHGGGHEPAAALDEGGRVGVVGVPGVGKGQRERDVHDDGAERGAGDGDERVGIVGVAAVGVTGVEQQWWQLVAQRGDVACAVDRGEPHVDVHRHVQGA